MLKPALLYRDEIIQKFTECLYTVDYYYYSGWNCGSSLPEIKPEENLYQYAFVDKDDNVIGFLTYRIYDYSDTAQEFGLFSFDRGNPIIGIDLFKKLEELVARHHRVEWQVIEGNPVKKHYDKFCKKHNGYIHHYHGTIKSIEGKYVDSYVYEIVNTKGENT